MRPIMTIKIEHNGKVIKTEIELNDFQTSESLDPVDARNGVVYMKNSLSTIEVNPVCGHRFTILTDNILSEVPK